MSTFLWSEVFFFESELNNCENREEGVEPEHVVPEQTNTQQAPLSKLKKKGRLNLRLKYLNLL